MFIVSVMYPAGKPLDRSYYANHHSKLVHDRWGSAGLREFRVLHGVPGPDGGAPAFQLIAMLSFDTRQAFEAAASQHGAEIFADIRNFTEAQPVVQCSEPAAS